MQINKVSDTSSLDSFFETMDRFNKKAGLFSSLDELMAGGSKLTKIKGLTGPGAKVLKQIGPEVEVKAILQAFEDGNNTLLGSQYRSGNEEIKALIYHLMEEGGDLSALTRKSKADLVVDYRRSKNLPAVQSPSSVAVRSAPSAPMGRQTLESLAEEFPFAKRVLRATGKETGPTIDAILDEHTNIWEYASTVTNGLRAEGKADPTQLKELTNAIAGSRARIDTVLTQKVDELDSLMLTAPKDLPKDGAKAAENILRETAERMYKASEESVEMAAKKLAEMEKALADASKKTGNKALMDPAKDPLKTIQRAKEDTIASIKALEKKSQKSPLLSRIRKAGWAVSLLKILGFAGLVGAGVMGAKYLMRDDDTGSVGGAPGASGARGDIGGASATTEDAIKRYLETGDTSALAKALQGSRFSNLMIFPEPIDGLSFAFFDSGRLKSPGERVLLPTHPETLTILRSFTSGPGMMVYNYERSKVSNPQSALNKSVQVIYQYGFYATSLGNTRARKYIMGRPFRAFPKRKFLGRRGEGLSPAQQKDRRPERFLRTSSDSDRLQKLNTFKKVSSNNSNSTNNHQNTDVTLFKEADETSKSYCKDAVKDLNNNDKEVREYFTGLGRLYDEKSENPKTDFGSLYNITDGSGSELVNSAHPKSVVILDSIGNGGLVENGLEQKEQSEGVAMSAPTGNYRSNYAWVRNMLEKKGSK
jgi:hypothetical protein